MRASKQVSGEVTIAPTDHRKKLSDAEVAEIRRLYFTERARQQTLAARFGVSQTQVSMIVRYKSRWSGPGVGERSSFGVPPGLRATG